MSLRDWIEVLALIVNAAIVVGAMVMRLQFKAWLNDHDKDPSAHANHARSARLEERFGSMDQTMNTISTNVAVVIERIENLTGKIEEATNAATPRKGRNRS